jgi:hypothetical protein
LEQTFARRWGRALVVLVAATCFTGSVHIHAALAQEPGVVIQGRVLWVAAERMVIAPYVLVPGAPGAISVDLSEARQDEYAGLKTGDSVAVTGDVPPEGDRVIATSIRRLAATGA